MAQQEGGSTIKLATDSKSNRKTASFPRRYDCHAKKPPPKPFIPSCEVFPDDDGCREDDTHEDIKQFLDQIKLETNGEAEQKEMKNKFTKGINEGRRHSSSKTTDKPWSSSVTESSDQKTSPVDSKKTPFVQPQTLRGSSSMEMESSSTKEGRETEEHTKLTELQIVSMWNHLKANCPTGMVNKRQLLDLIRQIFPRCSRPNVVVDNIVRLFDTEGKGSVAFRELIMTFTMSMQASPREKLHWIFRLYDKDGNEEIDEDEMTDIFVRLYEVALGAENVLVHKTLEPPSEHEKSHVKEETKKPKRRKSLGPHKMGELQVKAMSSKLGGRNLTRPKKVVATRTHCKTAEAVEAKVQEEAGQDENVNKAGKGSEADDEEKLDPVKRAKEIFIDLDIDRNGVVTEDEFVEGCLTDHSFLFMLEHFSCNFIWNDHSMN